LYKIENVRILYHKRYSLNKKNNVAGLIPRLHLERFFTEHFLITRSIWIQTRVNIPGGETYNLRHKNLHQ